MVLEVYNLENYSTRKQYVGSLSYDAHNNRWHVHRSDSPDHPHDYLGQVLDVYTGMKLLRGE